MTTLSSSVDPLYRHIWLLLLLLFCRLTVVHTHGALRSLSNATPFRALLSYAAASSFPLTVDDATSDHSLMSVLAITDVFGPVGEINRKHLI